AARSAFAVRRDMASFDASLSAAGNLAMAASGRYRFKAGTGQADIDLKSLRFGPMFMSFMRLVPNAAAVDLRAGTASGKARLSWNGRDVGGTATVAVKGLEMSDETTGTEIEGLNAQIHLDRLMPAQTPPGQILRIRRIAAGTDLTALTLRFSLESTPASVYPRLRIEGFDAGFIGGRLSVRPTVLDPVSGENRVAIDLTDVNLTALFALIGVEGVSGEGRLGGVIPVRQVGAAVDISGGRLAAAGPGTLRIRSAAVKRALAQGGKEVALMLSALEDFRYDSLTIDIDKKPQGDGRIRLKTDGHNPAVLDGRSFRININISGNVDRIAAVVAHALKLPAAVVRSIVPKAK
ncbi:MAG: YdbH domain-containing protein, partial [Rhodospirillales bacterium]